MIARVADHLFWLGRYIERAESLSRVLLVTRNLALDGELSPRQCWQPAVIVCGELPAFTARLGETALEDGEAVQRYLAWDEANAASILRSVAAARENARSIREIVSLELWEAVNEGHLWLQGEGRTRWEEDRHGFYMRVRGWGQACMGIVLGTMLHDDAIDFIGLGLMLERAGQTARILDVHHHALAELDAHRVVETALWLAVLRACSGFEPFMKRHPGQASGERVARFLLLDRGFPRSVAHALTAARRRLKRIRADEADTRGSSLARLRALETEVAAATPRALEGGDLHTLLTRVVDETHAICEEIGRELLAAPAPTETSGPGPQ